MDVIDDLADAHVLGKSDVVFPASMLLGPTACRCLRLTSTQMRIAVDSVLPAVERFIPPALFICGGEGENASDVWQYDVISDTWNSVIPLPAARTGVFAAGLVGHLLVCGGSLSGLESLPTTFALDESRCAWTHLSNMKSRRFRATGAVLGGELFVCGGSSWTLDEPRELFLRTFEMFSGGEWRPLPNLLHARKGAVAGRLAGGEIIVCGGYDGRTDLASVECFAAGTWRLLPPMSASRHGAIGAAISGVMYVSGGEEELATTERFDPSIGAWEMLRPMTAVRRGAASAVVGHQLYVFGGESFLVSPLAGFMSVLLLSAERFDAVHDEWKPITSLTTGRRFFAATAVAQ